jgi:aminoglycoside 6'-N-acetyltransferase
MSRYSFRPVVPPDVPMLDAWLRTPEVARWWGDPDEQAALLRADLSEPRMVMEIVSFGGKPFAYAQNYDIHIWPQPHFASLPPGSRAIDAFIGEPGMIGRGHGAAFLKALALRLRRAGAPVVAIDPDVENLRARGAYQNAGFRAEAVVETGDGLAALMIFAGSTRRDLARSRKP